MTDAERRPMQRMIAKGLDSHARGMGGRRRAYATPANAYPAGSLAGAPVRGCDSTSENLLLPSVWTCQNPTFHLVSKKLARADGVVVSHDRTKVVWCCVTKAQKSTTMAAALSFPNSTPARARLVFEQVSMKSVGATKLQQGFRKGGLLRRNESAKKHNYGGALSFKNSTRTRAQVWHSRR